jgi:hypothetical protein
MSRDVRSVTIRPANRNGQVPISENPDDAIAMIQHHKGAAGRARHAPACEAERRLEPAREWRLRHDVVHFHDVLPL